MEKLFEKNPIDKAILNYYSNNESNDYKKVAQIYYNSQKERYPSNQIINQRDHGSVSPPFHPKTTKSNKNGFNYRATHLNLQLKQSSNKNQSRSLLFMLDSLENPSKFQNNNFDNNNNDSNSTSQQKIPINNNSSQNIKNNKCFRGCKLANKKVFYYNYKKNKGDNNLDSQQMIQTHKVTNLTPQTTINNSNKYIKRCSPPRILYQKHPDYNDVCKLAQDDITQSHSKENQGFIRAPPKGFWLTHQIRKMKLKKDLEVNNQQIQKQNSNCKKKLQETVDQKDNKIVNQNQNSAFYRAEDQRCSSQDVKPKTLYNKKKNDDDINQQNKFRSDKNICNTMENLYAETKCNQSFTQINTYKNYKIDLSSPLSNSDHASNVQISQDNKPLPQLAQILNGMHNKDKTQQNNNQINLSNQSFTSQQFLPSSKCQKQKQKTKQLINKSLQEFSNKLYQHIMKYNLGNASAVDDYLLREQNSSNNMSKINKLTNWQINDIIMHRERQLVHPDASHFDGLMKIDHAEISQMHDKKLGASSTQYTNNNNKFSMQKKGNQGSSNKTKALMLTQNKANYSNYFSLVDDQLEGYSSDQQQDEALFSGFDINEYMDKKKAIEKINGELNAIDTNQAMINKMNKGKMNCIQIGQLIKYHQNKIDPPRNSYKEHSSQCLDPQKKDKQQTLQQQQQNTEQDEGDSELDSDDNLQQ